MKVRRYPGTENALPPMEQRGLAQGEMGLARYFATLQLIEMPSLLDRSMRVR